MFKTTILTTAIAAVGLAACAPIQESPEVCADPKPGRANRSGDVLLYADVSDSSNHKLKIIDGESCGGGSLDKGCISVPLDKFGTITFTLFQGKNQDCQGPGFSEYKLVGIELSEQSDKNFSDTVSQQVQCDYDTDAEGVVQSTNKVFQANKMTIEDQNMNSPDEPYFVWYKVTAVSCKTGREISTDPWIENKGTNPSR